MTAPAYCPKCGRGQAPDARFCPNCGEAFDPATAGAPQQGLAQGLLVVQGLWLKLVVGRLIGVIAGLAIWWFVAGPLFAGQFLPTIVALIVLPFAGLLIGQTLVLQAVAGRR